MTKHIPSQRETRFSTRRFLLLLFAGVIAVFAAVPQGAAAQQKMRADEKWLGIFTFEDAVRVPKRRKLTDVAPFLSYDISIERAANGELTATFNINGVQMFESYQCSVKTSGERVEFFYEKFVADGAPDTRKFKRGERLFSLATTKVGKATKYLFEPAAYKIARLDQTKQKQPVYFSRQ